MNGAQIIVGGSGAFLGALLAGPLLQFAWVTDKTLVGCPAPKINVYALFLAALIGGANACVGVALGLPFAAAIFFGALVGALCFADGVAFIIPDAALVGLCVLAALLAVSGQPALTRVAMTETVLLAAALLGAVAWLSRLRATVAFARGDYKVMGVLALFLPVHIYAGAVMATAPLALLWILIRGGSALPFGLLIGAAIPFSVFLLPIQLLGFL
ncbi:MAG: hypothetical protein JHD10_08735 [Sphingomonadaceae bacterium]|nr:hypothetical protein [Sphingomonadaceae bacterium]